MDMSEHQLMYLHRRANVGATEGCDFMCTYCKKSFQIVLKKFAKHEDDTTFTPHTHINRLDKDFTDCTIVFLVGSVPYRFKVVDVLEIHHDLIPEKYQTAIHTDFAYAIKCEQFSHAIGLPFQSEEQGVYN